MSNIELENNAKSKTYIINGKEYHTKRYTYLTWKKLLDKVQKLGDNLSVQKILDSDILLELLNEILDTSNNPIVDFMEIDFEVVGDVISDFFSRKAPLSSHSFPNIN